MEIRRGTISRRDWHSLPVPVWDRGSCKDLSEKWDRHRWRQSPSCKSFDGLSSRGTGPAGLSRFGTAAAEKTFIVTVAAPFFADVAVQRRGQARRASPPTPRSLANACTCLHK